MSYFAFVISAPIVDLILVDLAKRHLAARPGLSASASIAARPVGYMVAETTAT